MKQSQKKMLQILITPDTKLKFNQYKAKHHLTSEGALMRMLDQGTNKIIAKGGML